MALEDFIEEKGKKEFRCAQVRMSSPDFEAVNAALDQDGFTMQQVLMAALKQYLAERAGKVKRGKTQ